MRLARAGAADENGVALLGEKGAGREFPHQRLIEVKIACRFTRRAMVGARMAAGAVKGCEAPLTA